MADTHTLLPLKLLVKLILIINVFMDPVLVLLYTCRYFAMCHFEKGHWSVIFMKKPNSEGQRQERNIVFRMAIN